MGGAGDLNGVGLVTVLFTTTSCTNTRKHGSINSVC